MLVCITDRQPRGRDRIAEARRQNTKMLDLPVRQHKDLLPGPGQALHIHHKDPVGGKHDLIPHRLIGGHQALPLQQHLPHLGATSFSRIETKFCIGVSRNFIPKASLLFSPL